ncbi:MAG: metallophosphoesterase [Luteitalea sp.]|nr:metallophosphoesterase [Luteitalea sp.]
MRMHRVAPFAASMVLLGLLCTTPAAQAPIRIALPNLADSVKFVAIGDNGTGEKAQYEIGALMAQARELFPYDFVIMLGDNMYGSQRPSDFVKKFEAPYKTLLDAGVKFYAALGNHDKQENRFYKPWNMNGERYYTYTKKNVRFFVLDTDYLDRKQQDWIENELRSSDDEWKVVYFHHPLYSSGGRHGSEVDLREILEPLFIKYGVNAVFAGHDHIYERIKPQSDIYYFVSGSAGQLRRGDLKRSALTAAGYDQEQTFMLVEIDTDALAVQAIAKSGKTVDSASMPRQKRIPALPPISDR